MINFGKYAVLDGISVHFKDEPDWYWKIKPVDSGAELDLSKFMVHNRTVVHPDGSTSERTVTTLEVMHREIALTFGGTNIPADYSKPVAEGGEPFIPENATIEQVEAALRRMPHKMVLEVWKEIGAAYPGWGPQSPNKL